MDAKRPIPWQHVPWTAIGAAVGAMTHLPVIDDTPVSNLTERLCFAVAGAWLGFIIDTFMTRPRRAEDRPKRHWPWVELMVLFVALLALIALSAINTGDSHGRDT